MKRILIALVGFMMLAGSAMAAVVDGNPIDFPITAGVGNLLSLHATVNPMYFDAAGPLTPLAYDTAYYSNLYLQGFPRATVLNNGYQVENLTAFISSVNGSGVTPVPWTMGAAAGQDTAVLSGVFTVWTEDPAMTPHRFLAAADFGAEDVLTMGAQTAQWDANPATATRFAISGEVQALSGTQLAINDERSMRFCLHTPLTPSTATSQQSETIVVRIGAY
jgi:hypothetical protein